MRKRTENLLTSGDAPKSPRAVKSPRTVPTDERAFLASALFDWHRKHGRSLPWRAEPGVTPDPYRVWLSEIMLQQTTVKAVIPYFYRFLERFPDVSALANAETDHVMREWAGLGYYSRARNLHAAARAILSRHSGKFPRDIKALRELPGIGDYTAGAIAAIAFGLKEVAVDGNIERVIARFRAINVPISPKKSEIYAYLRHDCLISEPRTLVEALMDLGATVCTPKNPSCAACPLNAKCAAFAHGDSEAFPKKLPKKPKIMRFGAVFVAKRADGAILIETRPDKGLLGGMTGLPTTEWGEKRRIHLQHDAPLKADWRKLQGEVEHVFTHFPLRLTVYLADVPKSTRALAPYRWSSANGTGGEALPTLFKKVLAHAAR